MISQRKFFKRRLIKIIIPNTFETPCTHCERAVSVRMYIPTEMQYLFTCVNTSVRGLLAAKFEKYIGPENFRSERPVWRPLDPACVLILASSLIWRSHCASDSRLWSTRIEMLKIKHCYAKVKGTLMHSILTAFEYANWLYSQKVLNFRSSFIE